MKGSGDSQKQKTDSKDNPRKNVSDIWCTTGKAQFPFSRRFMKVLIKFSFWKKDGILDYDAIKCRNFRDIS